MGKNDFCCAKGCGHDRSRGVTCSFYRIPSDPGLRKAWLDNIARVSKVVRNGEVITQPWVPGNSSKLCSCHFEEPPPAKSRRKYFTVPTIFAHTSAKAEVHQSNRETLALVTNDRTKLKLSEKKNMPRKKRLTVGMPKKRRTQKISMSNEEAVEVENETTWPDTVVKIEVAEEDFDSLYQEHPFAVVSSADSEASFPVIDSAFSLHTTIKTEHDSVSESTGMDISRKLEAVAIYRNVAYQLDIVRYPIKLDHNYSSQDDSKRSGVETDNDFDGFLNSFNDKETAEENENIFHDLDVADNVTVETGGFQKLYNDLKEIVELPFILLKDEKIRILEHYEKMVKLCILIDSNLHMEIFVHNRQLPQTHEIFSFVSKEGVNVFGIKLLLGQLKEYQVCIGNPLPHCLERVSEEGFIYEGQSSKIIAYREDDFGARKNYFAEPYSETVRAVTCDLLLHIFRFKYKCPSCTRVGANLKSRGRRRKTKLDDTEIRKNYIHSNDKHSQMNKNQLIDKLKQQKIEMSCQTRKIETLERELSKLRQLKQVYTMI